MNSPLVSIIIPVYKGANYLREAVDSALAQTYKNIEIIVVNDGSPDEGATEAAALSYGDKIRYIYKENGGCSSALNTGIENMKGEYFSWLSHDDMYTPEKIACQVALMNEQNKDSIFMCGTAFIDKDSKPLNRPTRPWGNKAFSAEESLYNMFSGKGISGCSLLIPKKCFEKSGTFRTDILYMQDYDMWYRLFLDETPLVSCDTIGVLSRVHAMQTTVTGKSKGAADAAKVGTQVAPRLKGRYFEGKSLLKKYLFYCMRNRSYVTGKLAYDILCEEKELTLLDKVKANAIKLYGKARPFLVRVYYKLLFGIKVKK